MADTVLTELKIHEFDTVAQFLQHESEVGENDLALTPFMPANLYLFYHHWADHIVNDPSWLRADTFSWQSGDVYQSAYQHLAGEFPTGENATIELSDGTILTRNASADKDGYLAWTSSEFAITPYTDGLPKTGSNLLVWNSQEERYVANPSWVISGGTYVFNYDTIGDITITYYLAQDKHKICLPDQESNLIALYEKTGVAWFYVLDTDNKQFKLPRSKHNKYADTVSVVGNGTAIGLTNGTNNYGQFMAVGANGNYLSAKEAAYGTDAGSINNGSGWASNNQSLGVTTDPEKSGIVAQLEQDTGQYKHLYFYVGHFEQDSVEQTAGINTETFNSKADRNLMNTTDNVDIVIESQLPTEENGYTWYRKYKSGWVEQGGRVTGVSQDAAVTLPIEMANSYYSVSITPITGVNNAGGYESGAKKESQTTTGFHIAGIANSANGNHSLWQVSGMSA